MYVTDCEYKSVKLKTLQNVALISNYVDNHAITD